MPIAAREPCTFPILRGSSGNQESASPVRIQHVEGFSTAPGRGHLPRAPAFGSVHRSHGAGTTIHEVGARLGHRSIVTTNRYAHLFPARDEAIAEGLDALSREARKAADALHGAGPLRDPAPAPVFPIRRKGL